MKKVIALQKDGSPVLTTEATATKNGWWITYHLTVVLSEENECSPENILQVPKPQMLLMGLNQHVYQVATVEPRYVCYECDAVGKNRIGHKFYCNRHFKELVVTKPIRIVNAAPGRNDKCTCGSGKKYKHCCEVKNQHSARHYFFSDYVKMPAPAAANK